MTPPRIRSSTSLFGGSLPRLAENATPRLGEGREGTAIGPDERRLRIVERVIDLGDEGKYLIQVAADVDEVRAEIAGFRLALGITFGLLGLALVGTSVVPVWFGLRPLARLSAAVGAIRRGDAERIEGRYPDDIAPLAAELNLLIDANREILERARTQVGNLAHALKTPLSIVVNEVENAPDDVAARVREQATVMRDQVNYYLDRARAAALAGTLGSITEVEPVIAGLTRTFAKIYRDRALAIEVSIPPGTRFRGERQDLEEMIGNLIDNACKWSSERVCVTVEVRREDDRSRLAVLVDDDGPGLPEESRAQVLKRGRRLDETKPGSGLGLSIVADLAALYRGALVLKDSPAGGLRAVLDLPGDSA